MNDHTPKPFLMGSETEYAVSGLICGTVMDPDDVYAQLSDALQRQRAWSPDHHGYQGLYLEHGGRLYLDYGSHPEHATPECFTPRQVALYDKAGEHLLRLARDAVAANDPDLALRVIKNNLDPVEPDNTTYGTHESYTCWRDSDDVGPQLIPHLVSRMLYCGAGGLTGHCEGVGFELSQRARHLRQVESDDTTCNRAIFSTRIRKSTDAGDNWTRIHLICKDSQRAPFGIYLTFAATGLLIEMINRDLRVGKGLELADPLRAVRAFSLDPWGRAAPADRRPRTDGAARSSRCTWRSARRRCRPAGCPSGERRPWDTGERHLRRWSAIRCAWPTASIRTASCSSTSMS